MLLQRPKPPGQDGTSASSKTALGILVEGPAALHAPPNADGSGRRASAPATTVPGQRRRAGMAAPVAGPAKGWFLDALLELTVPRHDHAVGRRAARKRAIRAWLAGTDRHTYLLKVCERAERHVGQ